MEERALDTIDLEEELQQVDEMLASGALQVASESETTSRIEQALVAIANGVWAVIGLVLWLPQAARAILGAIARMVHAALTQQSSERAIAGIRRVSRFYVDRFLRRSRESSMVARRHELRPLRLLFEVAWAVAFYLLLLRWLSPVTFEPVWAQLLRWTADGRGALMSGAATVAELAEIDLASVDFTRVQVGAILTLAVVLGLLLGIWVGRRRA